MIEVDRIIDDVYYKGYYIYNNILRININKNSKENWFDLKFCDIDNKLELRYLNLAGAENPKEILLEIDENPFKYLRNLLIKTMREKYKPVLGNKVKFRRDYIQEKCESDMINIASYNEEYSNSPILNNIGLIKNYMSAIISHLYPYSSDIIMINNSVFVLNSRFTENNIPRVLLVEENNAKLIEYSKIMDYAS
jgi:hypothetical protein